LHHRAICKNRNSKTTKVHSIRRSAQHVHNTVIRYFVYHYRDVIYAAACGQY